MKACHPFFSDNFGHFSQNSESPEIVYWFILVDVHSSEVRIWHLYRWSCLSRGEVISQKEISAITQKWG